MKQGAARFHTETHLCGCPFERPYETSALLPPSSRGNRAQDSATAETLAPAQVLLGVISAALSISLLQPASQAAPVHPTKQGDALRNYLHLMKVGIRAWDAGLYESAEISFKAARASADSINLRNRNYASTLAYLATAYRGEGKLAEAEAAQQQCLALTRKLYPANDSEIAKQEKSLALIYIHENKLALAKPLIEHAVSSLFDSGPQYLAAYVRALNTLTAYQLQAKNYEAAEETAQKIANYATPAHMDSVLNYGAALTMPALVYYCEGNSAEAQRALKSALLTSLADKGAGGAEFDSLYEAATTLSGSFGDYEYCESLISKWARTLRKAEPGNNAMFDKTAFRLAQLKALQGKNPEVQSAGKPDVASDTPDMFCEQAEALYALGISNPIHAMYAKSDIVSAKLFGQNMTPNLKALKGRLTYYRAVGMGDIVDQINRRIQSQETKQ